MALAKVQAAFQSLDADAQVEPYPLQPGIDPGIDCLGSNAVRTPARAVVHALACFRNATPEACANDANVEAACTKYCSTVLGWLVKVTHGALTVSDGRQGQAWSKVLTSLEESPCLPSVFPTSIESIVASAFRDYVLPCIDTVAGANQAARRKSGVGDEIAGGAGAGAGGGSSGTATSVAVWKDDRRRVSVLSDVASTRGGLADAIDMLRTHPGTQELCIGECKIEDDVVALLHEVAPTLESLQWISFNGSEMPSSTTMSTFIVALKACPITRITISEIVLSDGLPAAFPSLRHLSLLQTLDIEGNDLTDDDCCAVANAMETLPSLTHLGLARNNLTDVGISSLIEGVLLYQRPSTVTLHGNDISQPGLDSFVAALGRAATTRSNAGAPTPSRDAPHPWTIDEIRSRVSSLSAEEAASEVTTLIRGYLEGVWPPRLGRMTVGTKLHWGSVGPDDDERSQAVVTVATALLGRHSPGARGAIVAEVGDLLSAMRQQLVTMREKLQSEAAEREGDGSSPFKTIFAKVEKRLSEAQDHAAEAAVASGNARLASLMKCFSQRAVGLGWKTGAVVSECGVGAARCFVKCIVVG